MAINLQKGQRVNLDSSMQLAVVGLGWDVNPYPGMGDFDLDASAFLLGANGKLISDDDFVFYNNLKNPSGSVMHHGDNTSGAGDGDDEVITIDFTKLPPSVEKIAICVSIYEAGTPQQNFGQVSNAFVRVAKAANEFDLNGEDQLRFDLTEEFSIERAVLVCEIYKYQGTWKFNAIGAGYQGGLQELVNMYQ
jgi:tellurium resistance protein TerD